MMAVVIWDKTKHAIDHAQVSKFPIGNKTDRVEWEKSTQSTLVPFELDLDGRTSGEQVESRYIQIHRSQREQ